MSLREDRHDPRIKSEGMRFSGSALVDGVRLRRSGTQGLRGITARPSSILDAEVIPAEIGAVILVPDAGVVERQDARRGDRQH